MPRPYPERVGNARLVASDGRRLAPEGWNGPRMVILGKLAVGRNRPKKGFEALARYLTEHEKSIPY